MIDSLPNLAEERGDARLPQHPVRGGLDADGRRLVTALLLSLVLHGVLLKLQFAGEGMGLPSLVWGERRAVASDLRIVLEPVPAQPVAQPPPLPVEAAAKDAPGAPGRDAPTLAATAPAAFAPLVGEQPMDGTDAAAAEGAVAQRPAAPAHEPIPDTTSAPSPMTSTETAPEPEPEPAAVPVPVPVSAMARSASSPELATAPVDGADVAAQRAQQAQAELEAQRLAAEQVEAARAEAARLEAERQAQRLAEQQEARRQAAASRAASDRQAQAAQDAATQEAQRQDAARQEAVRLEAERQALAARQAAEREAQRLEALRQDAARLEAARTDAARADAVRQEADRQAQAARLAAEREAERQEVARQVAAREEAARADAARAEAARQEAERQAAAAHQAAQQEARRQEMARQEAARLEAARQDTARAEAARLESERQAQAARLEAQRQEAMQRAAEKRDADKLDADKRERETRREAVLRGIGRQLDEEASRRDAAPARQPNALPYSLSTARRARLLGRADPNAELVRYAEAWAQKIQFNTAVETVRALAQRPHTTPVVTVAMRSDGSVESMSFVVSSGVPEVDEAIRRIVESQKPYPPFSAALARDYDVVEIRRTWYFDSAVRLQ